MFTRELVKCSPRAEIGQMSRILVVEDEDLIREMLVLALKAEVMRSQPLLMGERLALLRVLNQLWEVSL